MQLMTMIGAIAGCAAVAGAQTFDFGMFEGQWDNNTFGSSGFASIFLEDLGGGAVGGVLNLDGFVFGIGDPDPLNFSGSLAGDVFTLDPIVGDPTYGDVTGGIDAAGNLSMDLVNAAGGDFSLVTLRGTAIGVSIQFDYEIFKDVGTAPFAVGEVNVRWVPAPCGALIAMGGYITTRRRR